MSGCDCKSPDLCRITERCHRVLKPIPEIEALGRAAFAKIAALPWDLPVRNEGYVDGYNNALIAARCALLEIFGLDLDEQGEVIRLAHGELRLCRDAAPAEPLDCKHRIRIGDCLICTKKELGLLEAENQTLAAQRDRLMQHQAAALALVREMHSGLSFATLRSANLARLPLFKNRKGQPAHSRADGFDWSPAQWLQAVVGELGEYANICKKFERGDLDADEFAKLAADELADVQTYLDILAYRVGVDLGAATIKKWNEVSQRVDCALRINSEGDLFDGPKLHGG